MDYDYLLGEYRKLWKHRQLDSHGNAEWILRETILRELKDENSHPRVRRPIYEKFYFAAKRILDASISDKDKTQILMLHIRYIDEIKNEKES